MDELPLTKLRTDYQAGLLEDYAALIEQGGMHPDDNEQMMLDLRQTASMIRRLFDRPAVAPSAGEEK